MTSDTQHFTVFGGSYVAEHHNSDGFDVPARQRTPNVASWVVLCTLIAGISVFAAELAFFANGANRWLETGLMQ